MKRLTITFILLFFVGIVLAQSKADKDFQAIRAAMQEQQEDWNRGDIDAFMEHYWKSEDLQFIGSSGPTYGWQTTLENYKKNYPDSDAMGKLRFDILNMNRRSKKVVSVVGRFTLTRKNDELSGYFLLIWQKIKGKWVIVADHTS